MKAWERTSSKFKTSYHEWHASGARNICTCTSVYSWHYRLSFSVLALPLAHVVRFVRKFCAQPRLQRSWYSISLRCIRVINTACTSRVHDLLLGSNQIRQTVMPRTWNVSSTQANGPSEYHAIHRLRQLFSSFCMHLFHLYDSIHVFDWLLRPINPRALRFRSAWRSVQRRCFYLRMTF